MSQPIPYPCPHCGTTFSLTPEYLAQYGGQTTQCTTCGGAFSLPVAAALQQGGVAQAMPVLPYAGPTPASVGVWTEGRVLVAHKDADVGHCCIKCGEPAAGPRLRKKFYWHEPWVYLIILVGPVPYIIVAMCVRKSGALQYALCEKHRKGRQMGILWGLGLALAGIGLFFVAANVDDGVIWVGLGIILLFTGLIWSLLATRSLTPSRIDEHYLWLKGAGAEFLRTLPVPQTQAFPIYPYPPSRI